MRRFFLLAVSLVLYGAALQAQFVPVSVTGFNQDAVAESGTNSQAVTSLQLDGPPTFVGANSVLYTAGFASLNGGTMGLPNDGSITSTVSGAEVFQLASYSANNALYVFRNEVKELTLNTPASYSKISLLAFSAEGESRISISFFFADGTVSSYGTSVVLPDWFNTVQTAFSNGYGRIKRINAGPYWPAPAGYNNGIPGYPKFYSIPITLSCSDRQKNLVKIRITNVSTSTTTFPNAVLLGVSGVSFVQPVITPLITAADCTGPIGSIALTVSGTSNYSYGWSTNPVQSTATASGLAAGNYSCTITDAQGCATIFNGTVSLHNNATLSVTATPPAICTGSTTQLTVIPGIGTLTDFSWSTGSLTGTAITVSPTVTTTYVVAGTNASGCSAAAQITVIVQAIPAAPAANAVAVCNGFNATLTVLSPDPALSYRWYNVATGGAPLVTANSYSVTNVTTATTFYVEAISSAGCISVARTPVAITVNPIPGAALLSDTSVCPVTDALLRVRNPNDPAITYRWYSALTGGAPVSTGYTFSIVGVSAPSIWFVEAISTAGCVSTPRDRTAVSIIVPLPAPVVSVDTISFSSLSFSWPAVTGATGYLVSTNAGSTYLPPSSGSNGTRHTITGLPGNTSVTLLVKATGPTFCQTSAASGPVAATTLSTRDVFVPNVFTPNGDGKNDVLKVYANYVRSIDLKIFNQWGQLLFSTTDVTSGWDGKHKGQLQPVGVYAYTLKLIRQDGTTVNKSGAINLIH